MKLNRTLTTPLLLVTVSAAGYMFVSFIPRVATEYRQAAEFNAYWGYLYLAIVTASGGSMLALAGWSLWLLVGNTRQKRRARLDQSRNPSQMSAAEKQREIQKHLTEGQTLGDDQNLAPELRAPIRQSVEALQTKLESQTLEIVAFGTISSGKSSVLNALAGRELFKTDPKGGTTTTRNEIPWPGADKVVLVDTPGLAEVNGAEHEKLARANASNADMVLFVVDGPLKDFEFRLLAQLAEMEKRLLLVLNKEDWYSPRDLALLAEQISEQVRGKIAPEDIVTLRAQAVTRQRVRVLADGRELEETVEEEPDISGLARRMLGIVKHDGHEILLANLLLRARGLVADARGQVQAALDKQAEQVVERSMWQAGAAAALSPLPLVDVAAAMAISTKMVLELAKVYRQNVDLATAGRLMSELGKNLVSILGATLATPAIGSAVGSLLKTVPGVGTIAGGVLQGLVQVLITRWIGYVFIAYFRNEMREPEMGWAALARAKWNEVTRPAELTQLVKTGLARLGRDKK